VNEGLSFIDVRPVRTPEERQMFKEIVVKFLTHGGGDRTNPGASLLDAAAMSLHWNEIVDGLHAAGGTGLGPGNIYKKSRTHILKYYKSLEKGAAHRAVMSPIYEMGGLSKLREDLRKPVSRNVTGDRMSVAQSTLIAPTSLLKMLPLPTLIPAKVSSPNSGLRIRQRKRVHEKKTQLKQCSICGHVKNGEPRFRILHVGKEGSCHVPAAMRRTAPDCNCLEGYRQRKRNPHWHWCTCGCQGHVDDLDEVILQPEGKRRRFDMNPFGVSRSAPAASVRPSVRLQIVEEDTRTPAASDVTSSGTDQFISTSLNASPHILGATSASFTSPSAPDSSAASTGADQCLSMSYPSSCNALSSSPAISSDSVPLVIDPEALGEHDEITVEIHEEYRTSAEVNSGPVHSFMNSGSSRSQIRPGHRTVWLESCEKELLRLIKSSGEQNPFNQDPFLEDLPSDALEWNPSYTRYVPYRVPNGRARRATSQEKRLSHYEVRWGHTLSEPARLAFWSKVSREAEFRCRIADLLTLIRKNCRPTEGDGDCFYRSVLFSLGLPASNHHLLEFKNTMRTYFTDRVADQNLHGRRNEAASICSNLLREFCKGWLKLDHNEKRDAFRHKFTNLGWGSSTEYFPHIMVNRRFLLKRERPLVCISIAGQSFSSLHPESSTKLFVEGRGDAAGKVNEATLPLWIVAAYLVLLHDDTNCNFNLRTDLCAIVWKPGHFSHVLPCSTFETT
jgi:hypothetical protein